MLFPVPSPSSAAEPALVFGWLPKNALFMDSKNPGSPTLYLLPFPTLTFVPLALIAVFLPKIVKIIRVRASTTVFTVMLRLVAQKRPFYGLGKLLKFIIPKRCYFAVLQQPFLTKKVAKISFQLSVVCPFYSGPFCAILADNYPRARARA